MPEGDPKLTADTLECMQGRWEDNVGLTIQVVGSAVHFNDGTGIWKIATDEENEICVRGTKLLGVLQDVVHWQTPNGGRWEWTRMDPLMIQDLEWVGAFIEYKTERLRIRRRLLKCLEREDYKAASELQMDWESGAGFRTDATLEHQARMLAGKFLIPGSPVKFKRGGRGVIIGCEPWISAAAARRLKIDLRNFNHRLRPLYHCLIDARDHKVAKDSGNVTAFVLEHELEVCEEFPLVGSGIDKLMIHHHEIGAYTPGEKLEEALQRQRDGLPLVLWQ